METLIDLLGDQAFLILGGALIGMAFGFCASQSGFCLRAVILEMMDGQAGEKWVVWVVVVSTAIIATQALYLLSLFDSGAVRLLNNQASLSGAIIGGLMFGGGMILTGACASRMVVLSATGNLPMLLSWLLFALAALAAQDGFLSPLMVIIKNLWIISAADQDILSINGIGHGGGLALGGIGLLLALAVVYRQNLSIRSCLYGMGMGLTVSVAWWFNFQAASHSFELVPVHSISFTAPSSDLLRLMAAPGQAIWTFDLGLIPGVALASYGLARATHRFEWIKLEGASTFSAILGGCLMGVGGVLAGGCEIGVGVSGSSVFALTAWIVMGTMVIGTMVTALMHRSTLNRSKVGI